MYLRGYAIQPATGPGSQWHVQYQTGIPQGRAEMPAAPAAPAEAFAPMAMPEAAEEAMPTKEEARLIQQLEDQRGAVTVGRLPEWLYEPASFESFDYVGYVAVPALGAEATVVTFTVPDGRNGIIKLIGNNFVGAGFVEGSGDILWRIEQDTAAVKNYNAIPASLGNPALPSRISGIRVFERQVVALIVRNVAIAAPGGALSGGRLGGWFYPRNEEAEDIWL